VGDADEVIWLQAGPRPKEERPAQAGADAAIVVAVHASDAFMGAGAMAYLRDRPGLTLVPPSRTAEADVVLVLAEQLTDEVVDWMQGSAEAHASGVARFVVVSDWIQVPQLLRAASCGLLGVMPRQGSDYERVVRTILRARGGLTLPADGPDAEAAGLRGRELDVLRLVADGLDTAEIAQRLNYSESTIKNIIHVMLNRLQLKNRSHAVAFAIREGLL
jgi:DNA-binding NarL/FixJ family response regulator